MIGKGIGAIGWKVTLCEKYLKKGDCRMKKWMWVVVIGFLFVIPALAQAQLDKMLDRFKGDQRGEERIVARDLSVTQIEFYPDPIREGQRVSFQVTILNEARHAGRATLILRDKDEVIMELRDLLLRPGENRVDFSETHYRFDRSDHCFMVELVGAEQNRRRLESAREFCAQRTRSGWTLSDRGMGRLYVEDLDTRPDPIVPGQDAVFRVRLRNEGRPIRADIRIQDKDQLVTRIEDVSIPRGTSEFQFPNTRYRFQRFDHCFTVVVDFERTPYPVDAAREFCAKPMGWTLRP
jgi:hypothetical protein